MTTHNYYFIFQTQHLLLIKAETNTGYQLPAEMDLTTLNLDILQYYPLPTLHDAACFCIELPLESTLPTNGQWIPLRQAFELLDPIWISTACSALSILQWHKHHQYCGQCGHPTEIKPTPTLERYCSQCQSVYYPNAISAIIVRIQKDNQILMARSPHFAPGTYGLIAGFVELGETAEAAIQREVYEEVKLHIKNIRYFASQAWPFNNALLLGFTADYGSGTLCIDNHEIEAANWYTAHQLPGIPSSRLSLSTQLIEDFVRNHSVS